MSKTARFVVYEHHASREKALKEGSLKPDSHADAGFRLTAALTPAKRKQLRQTIPPCETS